MEKADSNDESIELEYLCPAPGCTYRHESVQGIVGHVGNGHVDGWEQALVPPSELHTAASMVDPGGDAFRLAKVRAWLRRNGVHPDAFQVYVHQGYGTVQLRHVGTTTELAAFRDLVGGLYAYHYTGEVGWLENAFVDELPAVERWEGWVLGDDAEGVVRFTDVETCDAGGCTQTQGVESVRLENGHKRPLCPRHAKQHWEVSS